MQQVLPASYSKTRRSRPRQQLEHAECDAEHELFFLEGESHLNTGAAVDA